METSIIRAAIALCGCGALYCQTPAELRFEVASVKPSTALPGAPSGGESGKGRLTMPNVTLKRCIMGAYAMGPNQIAGGPAWLDSDRFDIVAKADQPVGDSILMQMLQALLAERFKLAVRRESRMLPAYILEVAKKGPKLEKSTGEAASTQSGRGAIAARNMTMSRFAEVLSRQMDLPVVNRTGLDGAFNLKVEWVPDASPADRGPSIFAALQEQLGLHLAEQKAPLTVLVIDHAEKPSEN